ncbi:MAG TPA: polysaccharide deacetylase family protein [Clostridia bacterium]
MPKKILHKFIITFMIAGLFLSGCTSPDSNKTPGTAAPISTAASVENTKEPVADNSKSTAEPTPAPSPSPKTTKPAIEPGEKKSSTIPVLMYHSIRFEKGNDARMSKETFESQMKWLSENGYNTLTMDELFDHISGEKAFNPKSVVITLDDGYRDNYENAFPILKKYNIHATIFMITNAVGHSDFLTEDQLKEMSSNGVDIEPHTVHHDRLDELTYEKQFSELKDSKEYLEKLTGKTTPYIAYPEGHYNNNTLKAVKDLGYKMAFLMSGGRASVQDSRYLVKRVYCGEFGIDVFKSKVES